MKVEKILTKDERDFIDYLEDTLIPDLEEMGRSETAEDFKRCIWLIQKLVSKIVRTEKL